MDFEQAGYLWLLLLLPVLWLLLDRYLASGRKTRERWGKLVSSRRELCALWSAALGYLCLVLALAGPFVEGVAEQPQFRQKDLVLLLDASPSMNTQDVWPSRMERAKQVIRGFVLKDTDMARFGLVSFSQSSIILSYLTADPRNLLFYLEFLRPDRRTLFGTDIGAALVSGLQILQRQQQQAGPGEADLPESGLMVLISDGEDQGEGLAEALRQVQERRIRVHCVGIGTSQGGTIPLMDEEGSPTYLADEYGVPLISQLTVETLQKIADTTGGRFFRASSGPALEEALDSILKAEKEIIGYRVGPARREIFHYFVGLGFLAQLSLMTLRF